MVVVRAAERATGDVKTFTIAAADFAGNETTLTGTYSVVRKAIPG
jgi:hypothetical protein